MSPRDMGYLFMVSNGERKEGKKGGMKKGRKESMLQKFVYKSFIFKVIF